MKGVKGFLLFEVIISIVIITAGLLFVMRAYSSSKAALEKSPPSLSAAYKAIDKSAKKGLIKNNKAARMKSKLAKLLSKSSQ